MEENEKNQTEIGKRLKKAVLFEIYFDFSGMAKFWLENNEAILSFKSISHQMKFKKIIYNENNFIFEKLFDLLSESKLNSKKLLEIIPLNNIKVFIQLVEIIHHHGNDIPIENNTYQDLLEICNNQFCSSNDKYRNFFLKIILLNLKKGDKKDDDQLLSEIKEFIKVNKSVIENILEFRPIEQYNACFFNQFPSICDFSQKELLFEECPHQSNNNLIIESFNFLANLQNNMEIKKNWQLIAQNASKSGFQLFFYFLVNGMRSEKHSQIFSMIAAETFYKNKEYVMAKKISGKYYDSQEKMIIGLFILLY